MQTVKSRVRRLLSGNKTASQRRIQRYLDQGRVPWSEGYDDYRRQHIQGTLETPALMRAFRAHQPLPVGYGWGLDERVVEYPWLFAQLLTVSSRLLDAGSTLNYEEFIDRIQRQRKDITILTLAPESRAFWQRGVSYHFGDLRELPFRDEWFDEIVCLSTLEHVGMDNRYYGAAESDTLLPLSYLDAAKELWRTLKAGGTLYISLPFGQKQAEMWDNHVFFQQFDGPMIEQLLDCFPAGQVDRRFFRYSENGWQASTQEACADAIYFNVHAAPGFDADHAAAARAVCCLQASKER